MLRFILFLQIILFSSLIISQNRFPSYFIQNDMEMATPGTTLFGLAGYDNPAELSFLNGPNLYFTWNDKESDFNDFNNWGLFSSIPYLGFSVVNQKQNSFSITDYKLSASFGSAAFSLGMAYGWSKGVLIFSIDLIFTQ